MANLEHLAALDLGVEQWNKWRDEFPEVQPNLEDANLTGRNLYRVNFHNCNLHRADLAHANLRSADLSLTNLREVLLTHAILLGANFRGSEIDGADFTHSVAGATIFADIDLSVAQGLHSVRHGALSTIGIDTIYKSRGHISEVFLRGCGVAEDFIAYISSLADRVAQFYSCFISYSMKDQDFASRLYADLQARGIRCWFAPQDMRMGTNRIFAQISEAINQHDKLLLILSENSASSHWVQTEVAMARQRELRTGSQVLFPLSLMPISELLGARLEYSADPQTLSHITDYLIADFSNWHQQEAYQRGFSSLVKNLALTTALQFEGRQAR
jgi:hypothetical protein